MGQSPSNTDSVLEILDAGSGSEWHVAPGIPVEYPISIRNGTQDSHEIEVSIADSVDWAHVTPARLALAAGGEAATTLLISIPRASAVAAGRHDITLELHDFEGTSFGQLVSSINVLPVYRLDMSVTLRGALVRGDLVGGFVLRCTLVNHGNAECAVELSGDANGCATFHAPQVRVPQGGDVTVDIEARWTSDALLVHPAKVTIVATYPGGETSADVAWSEVVKCLGSAIPPLRPQVEFPEIVPWRSGVVELAEPSTQTPQTQRPAGEPSPTAIAPRQERPLPIRVQINGPSPYPSMYGRRLHPWWPPMERIGGHTHVKRAPIIAALVLTLSVAAIVALQNTTPRPITPLTSLSSVLPASAQRVSGRYPHSIAAISRPTEWTGHHPTAVIPRDSTNDLPRLPNASHTMNLASSPNVDSVSQTYRTPAPARKGPVWEGRVLHISAGNIKVYDSAERVARSFILAPGFKSVYAADGIHRDALSNLRAGAIVQVYYSYTLGIRHSNAILIIRRATR